MACMQNAINNVKFLCETVNAYDSSAVCMIVYVTHNTA